MASLPIEYEVVIPLLIALFFSLLYELDRDENFWAGCVAMMVWLVTGLVYLIVSNFPSLGLIFNGVGIIYVVRIVIAAFKPLTDKQKRTLEGEKD